MSLVDRQRVIVGSANLDSRSMYINRELMAVSSSRDVTDAATSFVDRISGYATPPVTEELRVKMPRFVGRVLEHVL